MGITFGDYLIDSGYHDITPEQEREIDEAARLADKIEDLAAEFGAGAVPMTAADIIARAVCAELNDLSFDDLPEAATYLERKTFIDRPILDQQEARCVSAVLLSALAASDYRILAPDELDAKTIEACAKVAQKHLDPSAFALAGPASVIAQTVARIRALAKQEAKE